MVTLSKNAENTAVASISNTNNGIGSPFTSWVALMAIHSKSPVSASIDTIIIIPTKRNITFRSIALKASSAPKTPVITITIAPNIAKTDIGNFSKIINIYAKQNIIIATNICDIPNHQNLH